jgi:formyl-CoA transferase
MSLNGEPDGQPLRVPAGLGDSAAGMHCAIGILAAIVQRQATGVGQQIEVAQQDVVVSLSRIHLREHYLTGRPALRRGNRQQGSAPVNLYRCRPGGPNDYVFIHAVTADMFQALMRVVGRDDLADDPSLRTRQGRFDRVDEIDGLIEAWTGKHGKREAMEILAGAGVACGAVLDTGEVLTDEHLRGRGMIVDVDDPERGRFPMPANPIHMSASPTEVRRAPRLGEHNAEVYGTLLGLDAAALAALAKDRVI